MLVIRFFRTGKINQPSFKIVVTEKTNSSTRGRFVEQLGTYNPTTKEKTLNAERAKYWIGVGAQPSETVHNLFVSEKIIEGKKVDLHKKSKKAAEVKPAEAPAAPVEAKPVEPAPIEIPAEKPAEEKKPEEANPEAAEAPKIE
jgi:small subunit ribosomal protein S16